MMQFMVELPLGWPNGDAGSGRVRECERYIQETYGYTHGRDAFGTQYPEVDLLLFADCVCTVLSDAIKKAMQDADALKKLRENTDPGMFLADVSAKDTSKLLSEAGRNATAAYIMKMIDVAFSSVAYSEEERARQLNIGGAPLSEINVEGLAYFVSVIDEIAGNAHQLRT
jgi:hypothetical protein